MDTPTQGPRLLLTHPLALGLLAVLMFAMTIPMTRLAGGDAAMPQIPPLVVALGRGALAAVPAVLYLAWVRAPLPRRHEWPWLLGVVVGGPVVFPVCMGWAVHRVPAGHAAVVTGVLPLLTATLASWWMGQRAPWGFWLAGGVGIALVLGFVTVSHGASTSLWQAQGADAVLLLGMLGAAVAYVAGARATRQRPAAQVMSWALVLALPLTASGTLWVIAVDPVAAWAPHVGVPAWWALAYVALCSSWLGFFAWYAALARDTLRVSQLQLLQPFASMAIAAVGLGEHLHAWAPVFAVGVGLAVWAGQRQLQETRT